VLALNFNGILADYDLTVFLYHPLFQTLGVVIKNSTDAQAVADTRALTLVYSVILMIMSSIVLYFVYGRQSKD
jgi:iron(III) transport system permease protein